MQHIALLTALSLIVSSPAFSSDLSTGIELGKTREEMATSLHKEGYKILKQEKEHGNKMEIYIEREGKEWEVKVDMNSGRIIEIERE